MLDFSKIWNFQLNLKLFEFLDKKLNFAISCASAHTLITNY